MRLDKFLKNSRLIKRRTVAREACDLGHIELNGKVAKAGAEVKVGDQITIHFGRTKVTVEVTDTEDNPGKQQAQDQYKILEEVRVEETP